MIEATGAESEKDAFDAKKAEIADAMAAYFNTYTNYFEKTSECWQVLLGLKYFFN